VFVQRSILEPARNKYYNIYIYIVMTLKPIKSVFDELINIQNEYHRDKEALYYSSDFVDMIQSFDREQDHQRVASLKTYVKSYYENFEREVKKFYNKKVNLYIVQYGGEHRITIQHYNFVISNIIYVYDEENNEYEIIQFNNVIFEEDDTNDSIGIQVLREMTIQTKNNDFLKINFRRYHTKLYIFEDPVHVAEKFLKKRLNRDVTTVISDFTKTKTGGKRRKTRRRRRHWE